MATAKKCDRCGKYYDKNTGHKQNVRGKDYYEDGMCFTTVAGVCDYFKDLCDNCLEELHMFLNGTPIWHVDINDCSIECEDKRH